MLNVAVHPEFDPGLYRNEAHLRDGTKILMRPMVAEDMEALFAFFKGLPREETQYLRDDVASHLLIEKWAKNLDYDKTLPILAVRDDRIIADATLNRRRAGWKWHLGTVRLFVHKDYRRIGLGHLMIRGLCEIADKLGLEKLVAEVPDANTAAIKTFVKAGFHRAALIPNLAKNKDGMPLDIAVMTHDLKRPFDEADEYGL